MDANEFLQAMQIVELTRDYPKLKAVMDAMLKKCEDHAQDLLDKAAKAEPVKAEDDPKASDYSPAMRR